jgi:hypothetical protein
MSRSQAVAFLCGLALIVGGVAAISWRASLIVSGILMCAVIAASVPRK